MDVDMLDVADLEKERGDPGDVDMTVGNLGPANSTEAAEQDELNKARLQR